MCTIHRKIKISVIILFYNLHPLIEGHSSRSKRTSSKSIFKYDKRNLMGSAKPVKLKYVSLYDDIFTDSLNLKKKKKPYSILNE